MIKGGGEIVDWGMKHKQLNIKQRKGEKKNEKD